MFLHGVIAAFNNEHAAFQSHSIPCLEACRLVNVAVKQRVRIGIGNVEQLTSDSDVAGDPLIGGDPDLAIPVRAPRVRARRHAIEHFRHQAFVLFVEQEERAALGLG